MQKLVKLTYFFYPNENVNTAHHFLVGGGGDEHLKYFSINSKHKGTFCKVFEMLIKYVRKVSA